MALIPVTRISKSKSSKTQGLPRLRGKSKARMEDLLRAYSYTNLA